MDKPKTFIAVLLVLAAIYALFLLLRPQPEEYVACGCGCCGGTEPKGECLYHAKGDDMGKIIADDGLLGKSPDCAYMGCSIGHQVPLLRLGS